MGSVMLTVVIVFVWLVAGLVLGSAVAQTEIGDPGSNGVADVVWRGFLVSVCLVMAPLVAGAAILAAALWLLGHLPELPSRLPWRRRLADQDRIAELEAEIAVLAREQDPS